MEYKYQYNTKEERQQLLNDNSTKLLIEEQNITEGNFLFFGDTARLYTITQVITPEEQRIRDLQQDNLILMDALATTFEEILVLEDKINTLGGTPA